MRFSYRLLFCVLTWLGCLPFARSSAAADRLPPPGITIPAEAREELSAGAANLRTNIDSLTVALKKKPKLLALLPDVEIFHKAVDWALRYDEFFEPKQVDFAKHLLKEGNERVEQLRAGHTPWLNATGLVVRGFQSKLDGSIQPYGMVVPPGWHREYGRDMPLWVWLAGRNEKRTELAFLNERETSAGSFTPTNAIVLHPYGRFCNATKFAGEIDVFEALNALRKDYQTDSNRVLVAGFSMGGASAWHLAVHHAGRWCGASPGAGFAETELFAHIADDEPPPWWEKKLYSWYDATDYAGNLFNCKTIAYSGEIDPQKQSADIMEAAMAKEGLKLERLIGPGTAHKYEPATRTTLEDKLMALTAKGRDPMPPEIHLTTYTLRYPQLRWVRIEGMERHWERADVRAKLDGKDSLNLNTTNVTMLRLLVPNVRSVGIDGQRLSVPKKLVGPDVVLTRVKWKWSVGTAEGTHLTRKTQGLTGPIDDAFMRSFLFVRPTGKPINETVGKWAQAEMEHAIKMWRDVFRAEVPIVDDIHLTEQQAATNNLILWGDPRSNHTMGGLLDSLPLRWDEEKLAFHGRTYEAENHVPILIYPSSENREYYIVINSGIDFRNDAYGSNARQTPKLPDYSIIDLDTPPGPRWPGKIVDAGFFDENWELAE
jgi:pimeloyl-ACP methyl ester carboxylesterase